MSSTSHTVWPAGPPGVMLFTIKRVHTREPLLRTVRHSTAGEPSAANASPMRLAND